MGLKEIKLSNIFIYGNWMDHNTISLKQERLKVKYLEAGQCVEF